jgi:hypothetical protein
MLRQKAKGRMLKSKVSLKRGFMIDQASLKGSIIAPELTGAHATSKPFKLSMKFKLRRAPAQ